MDVVKTNVLELGGEVKVESKLGMGSTFRVILPLTLAIIDSMVLSYSNEKFVIPLGQVFETLRPTPEMLQHNTSIGETLMVRSENIPLFRLGDFFGLKNHFERGHGRLAIVVNMSQRVTHCVCRGSRARLLSS